MGVGAGGNFAVAAGDRHFGAGMLAAAAGRMAVGDRRRARSGACSSAGWGGNATARDVAAGAEAEAGRALSDERDRGMVVVLAGCLKGEAMAAERDEVIEGGVGRGWSRAGEGAWGRWWSRCSILGLPWWRVMGAGGWRLGVEVV